MRLGVPKIYSVGDKKMCVWEVLLMPDRVNSLGRDFLSLVDCSEQFSFLEKREELKHREAVTLADTHDSHRIKLRSVFLHNRT